MIEIEAPSSLSDLTALAYPSGIGMRAHFQAMMLQLAQSDTMTFRMDGQAKCIIGFWKLPEIKENELHFELWLVISADASEHMLALWKIMRRTLARLGETQPVRIRALVRKGHAPGERMARLLGFEKSDPWGAFHLWEWSSHG